MTALFGRAMLLSLICSAAAFSPNAIHLPKSSSLVRASTPVMPIGVPKVSANMHSPLWFNADSFCRASISPTCAHIQPLSSRQVAYRVPGAQYADWVDLYNRLYRERILFLGQEINDEIANQVIGVMLYLDSEDNAKTINLYINSPGGSVS